MLKKLLIILSVICSTFAVLIVLLQFINNANIDTQIKGSNDMQVNYTTTESNTWDISADETSDVTATLSEEGVLTISGTGAMNEWANNEVVPWYNIREQIKVIKIQEGITSIGDFAFNECSNLTDITIPEEIITIGKSAFEKCSSLEEIVMPETVTSIGTYAFASCSSLTKITIPSKVTSIDLGLFAYCSNLIEIIFSEGITNINDYVFMRCDSLTEVIIPKGVISIGTSAFEECNNLINIEVDEGNTKYCDENGVLYTKDKKKIVRYPSGKEDSTYTILDTVTAIEDAAFYQCNNLQEIIIPEGVTNIKYLAFGECANLLKINIPQKVTKIDRYAFAYCKALTKITIPESVTSIGTSAFSLCDNLTILCHEGSVAETYAQENEIPYEIIYLTSDQQTIDEEALIIRGIEPKTTVEEFKTTIQTNVQYEIINKSGDVMQNTEIIGTGYKLKLSSGKEYTLVVMGDLNGDGEIAIAELARTSRLGISQGDATEIEMMAIDVNMDGNIKVNDIAAISRLARE